jgi:DNA repair protein RadD
VNVSVLTTGFDAPHVDVIAILRPTESVSLYQQIVGRGLRLSPGKTDCLVLDYTGQDHDIFSPTIEEEKPDSRAVVVPVDCPQCGFSNQFWGIQSEDGSVEEHFGRKCQAAAEIPGEAEFVPCGYLFRFKRCDACGVENDVAARECRECGALLVDNDKKLKEAMSLKDAHVMRVDSMRFRKDHDKRGTSRLAVDYFDADANQLKEYFYFDSDEKCLAFQLSFARMHLRLPEEKLAIHSVDDALAMASHFRPPFYVIARKKERYWAIREKIF